VLDSDGRGGFGHFLEGAVEAPVDSRVAARFAFRRAWHAGPSTDEISLSILMRPRPFAELDRWNFGWSVGGTWPGALGGRDRSLSAAPLWQLTGLRTIGSSPYRLGIALGTTGHESKIRTQRGQVSGNQRGKEIFDLSVLADRSIGRVGRVRWRAGIGVRAARWHDQDPLLLDPGGAAVEASTEVAGLASLAGRMEVGAGVGLVGRAEQVYWPSIGLSEFRVMLGLEAGAPEAPPRSARPSRAVSEGGRPRFMNRLVIDFRDLSAVPWHMNGSRWRFLAWGSAAVGAAYAGDGRVRSAVQRNRSSGSDRLVDDLRPLGNQAGALSVIGLIWLGGRLSGDADAVAIGEDAFEATIFSNLLIVPALKAASGRARPDAELGRAHFKPFSGADAFPSGEAAQAFTIASVVAVHARAHWVKVVGWSLAGVLAYGRVHLDRHWTSDVVAGALIGAGVGSWVAARRVHTKFDGKHYAWIMPLPTPGGIQIRGSFSW